MGYWKSKVLPKIKKVFEKNGAKKVAAAEASKSFDDSKEEINKELEEKKTELGPKVLEIYEASALEIKTVVKERTDAGVKKHPAEISKFLEELVKIDFPGSKLVSEASSKFGPVLVSGPVIFLLEKVSTFIPVPVEEAVAVTAETTTVEAVVPEVEESSSKEKDVVVEEGEKDQKVAPAEETTTAAAAAALVEPVAEPVKAVEGEVAPKA